MINHVRTLLLNQNDTTSGLGSGIQSAELVDPGFQPLVLPNVLKEVVNTLLPSGYTSYQRNKALNYLISFVHTPELAPYTLKFDTRITYLTPPELHTSLAESVVDVSTWSDTSSDTELRYTYTANKLATNGTVMRWSVVHTEDNNNTVLIRYEDGIEKSVPVTIKNNLTDSIALIDNCLYFRLYSPSGELNSRSKFDIVFYAPLNIDAVKLLAKLRRMELKRGDTHVLFDPYTPYTDQLNELKQIWQTSNELTLQLGSYILALAYQLERLRLNFNMPSQFST